LLRLYFTAWGSPTSRVTRWISIFRASAQHGTWEGSVKSFCYSVGWKKLEPLWDAIIRLRQLRHMRPMLEAVLAASSSEPASPPSPSLAPRITPGG
jgi:hypothetical protein